ncbi:hypothetical protein SEA_THREERNGTARJAY_171 [Mycobacterium phage ThreeRngTarjay]|uniref:Uncharacterized protein n=2 Tax=Omegavirus courthouse TaxID=1089119 RepID=G8I5M9_9CAUD|nr:hypothetical protein CM09_gp172 [Mycobacterium phage Courthouse]YP_009213395.1 hypothetical protein AVV70_gp178 [Mycobacterium phage MiaZeal]ATS93014.1 hypothetical protein SEA_SUPERPHIKIMAN_173 [Mycobacterium phage Superphikiman]QBI99862.1 hypothetical protein SEA_THREERNGTARJAY_171 [Mycobacterium phage ThreeRngTarjay]AER48023.1 hypothetical protein COURTHOUSE_172 [Mycobacterium phage Courthouse]AIY32532.1 hypothetical protein PBI_MIAZEAL_178 [Mycobacterium phage MiaZeal]
MARPLGRGRLRLHENAGARRVPSMLLRVATLTAFSNSTEFEIWSINWCGRCVRDEHADSGFGCPILDTVYLENRVPPEWSEGTDDLRDRYHCSEFEPS